MWQIISQCPGCPPAPYQQVAPAGGKRSLTDADTDEPEAVYDPDNFTGKNPLLNSPVLHTCFKPFLDCWLRRWGVQALGGELMWSVEYQGCQSIEDNEIKMQGRDAGEFMGRCKYVALEFLTLADIEKRKLYFVVYWCRLCARKCNLADTQWHNWRAGQDQMPVGFD